jgi:excinuclease ABC subunit A
MDKIEVRGRGARTHNLKNINLTLPRDKLIVVTGLSGSGKSSLAFDTLYAEGQRRYVESLSAYARQFLSLMEKPDVDHIEGLSPAISIEQKSTSHNPRSTVGTITEIYDYLRLLFARVGEPRCPDHAIPLAAQTISQMVDQVLAQPEGQQADAAGARGAQSQGGAQQAAGEPGGPGLYPRPHRWRGVRSLRSSTLELHKKHTIEVVVDRFKVRDDLQLRLAESFETALTLSGGIVWCMPMDGEEGVAPLIFSANFACPECGYSMSGAGAAHLLLQQPGRCLPHLRRPRGAAVLRSAKVIHDPSQSLAGGAIRGWDKRSFYYFQMLKSLAEHYKFDLEAPWEDLPVKTQEVILRGSGRTEIEFRYMNDRGDVVVRKHPFEGILHNMERRYRETESNSVREELAKYIANKSCTSCGGSRLREEARHVFVDNRNLPAIAEQSIGRCARLLRGAEPERPARPDRREDPQGDSRAARLPGQRGPQLPEPVRSAETLSGGEAQRIRLASQIGAGLVGVMYVLDEPSIGLHQRDNERLLKTLFHLRDLGNTVIVVEHDEDAIRLADHVLDIGPGAGVHGGAIVAQGHTGRDHRQPRIADR